MPLGPVLPLHVVTTTPRTDPHGSNMGVGLASLKCPMGNLVWRFAFDISLATAHSSTNLQSNGLAKAARKKLQVEKRETKSTMGAYA